MVIEHYVFLVKVSNNVPKLRAVRYFENELIYNVQLSTLWE